MYGFSPGEPQPKPEPKKCGRYADVRMAESHPMRMPRPDWAKKQRNTPHLDLGSAALGNLWVTGMEVAYMKVRMAVADEDIWAMPSALGNVLGGHVVHRDILEEIYAEINEMYGTDVPVPE